MIAPNLQQHRELRKLFLRLPGKTMEANHPKDGTKPSKIGASIKNAGVSTIHPIDASVHERAQ
jgi:hypothetical protein